MNTRSLRFRLVAWYAGWLTALFIVFGFFVYISLDHLLERSLREALARRTRQVADLVQRSPNNWPALGNTIQINFAPEANSRFTRVTVNGTVRYVSGAPLDGSYDPGTVPPVTSPDGDGETFAQRTLPDGTPMFVVMLRRSAAGSTYIVEEGSSGTRHKATLRGWLATLVAGLVLLILAAVLGGSWLVRWALAPVDHIISSAERISTHNLRDRLPVPNTGDQLERLSTALNNMIHRLDDGFQHTQRFLADASHELRTPLTIIQAELEAVIDGSESARETRERAGSVLEEVERLRKIVEGLFALNRLDAGEALEERVPFDLGELAASTTEQMWLLAEDKRISLVCHRPQKVTVEGDRARLKQVVVNLLDNAIKYTPSGGKIEVSVSAREGNAFMEVADNGMGIPAEALPHLFERFFRVDKARSRELGGSGIGLSIVKSICTAHGGRVEARSKVGEGSRFIVELPLASDHLSRPPSGSGDSSSAEEHTPPGQ